jgi:hypothetical protein
MVGPNSRDEGTCIHDLELRSHTGQVMRFSNLKCRLVFLAQNNLAENVVYQLCNLRIFGRHKIKQRFDVLWVCLLHLLHRDLIHSFESEDLNDSTFDLLIDCQNLLCRGKIVNKNAKEF